MKWQMMKHIQMSKEKKCELDYKDSKIEALLGGPSVSTTT